MGLEPTTFALARRRSSQLSYIRVAVSIEQAFRRGRDHRVLPSRLGVIWGVAGREG